MVAKLDSQDWRDKYDALRGRFQKLYTERMPVLKDYERTVNTALSDLLGEVVPAAREYFDQSRGLGDVVSGNYIPALKQYMDSAANYDTADRRQQARQGAMTDVMTAGDAARRAALDRLESYGIDPSVTRSASLDQNARLASALEAVKQAREAEVGVEERGRAYMSDALDKGQSAMQGELAYGSAGSNMLTSGVNAANTVGSTWANIFGTPVQNLELQKGLVDASLQAKATEVQSKQAAQGMKGSAIGQIGSTLGTVAGAVGGAYIGSAAGPMGTIAGMEAGAKLGSSVSGGGGMAAAQQLPPIY